MDKAKEELAKLLYQVNYKIRPDQLDSWWEANRDKETFYRQADFLIKAGYRLVPKLEVIGDEEIKKVAQKVFDDYYEGKLSIRNDAFEQGQLREKIRIALIKAQRDFDQKQLSQ